MTTELDGLLAEHVALGRQYAAVQRDCSRVIREQRERIERLEAQLVRARAKAIVRESALAFAAPMPARGEEDLGDIEASLKAADLVICQTGCLSDGAYWRVRDHCRRTGKACVVVEQPEALRIMRINRPERV